MFVIFPFIYGVASRGSVSFSILIYDATAISLHASILVLLSLLSLLSCCCLLLFSMCLRLFVRALVLWPQSVSTTNAMQTVAWRVKTKVETEEEV